MPAVPTPLVGGPRLWVRPDVILGVFSSDSSSSHDFVQGTPTLVPFFEISLSRRTEKKVYTREIKVYTRHDKSAWNLNLDKSTAAEDVKVAGAPGSAAAGRKPSVCTRSRAHTHTLIGRLPRGYNSGDNTGCCLDVGWRSSVYPLVGGRTHDLKFRTGKKKFHTQTQLDLAVAQWFGCGGKEAQCFHKVAREPMLSWGSYPQIPPHLMILTIECD